MERDLFINWNAVPWHMPASGGKTAKVTAADAREALPYMHEFVTLLTELRVVVMMMGGFARDCWLRYLRQQADSPVLPLAHRAPSGRPRPDHQPLLRG